MAILLLAIPYLLSLKALNTNQKKLFQDESKPNIHQTLEKPTLSVGGFWSGCVSGRHARLMSFYGLMSLLVLIFVVFIFVLF